MDNNQKALIALLAVGGFVAYRYYIFGKGNRGLINPTLLGF
jgi:hypothetical protein